MKQVVLPVRSILETTIVINLETQVKLTKEMIIKILNKFPMPNIVKNISIEIKEDICILDGHVLEYIIKDARPDDIQNGSLIVLQFDGFLVANLDNGIVTLIGDDAYHFTFNEFVSQFKNNPILKVTTVETKE